MTTAASAHSQQPGYGWTPSADQLGPPALPQPRGPLTGWLLGHLASPPHDVGRPPAAVDDPVHGEDSALVLYVLYELHYRGFAGVDEDWEWEPSLLAARGRLERVFVARVRELVGELPAVTDAASALSAGTSLGEGPSLSMYAAERASLDELRELAVHRSAWQLKEADPHSWALPRLSGKPKAALVEIQKDEYGEGLERDMHQVLFGLTMSALGLDPSYGRYLDHLPAVTLATVNLVSFFGLHRRWRGALCGHLATFEMTSVEPMGNYAAAMRRLGMSTDSRHFYEVHVVADAHHATVAAQALAGGIVEQEPELLGQLLFGAAAVTVLERAFADHALRCFTAGETSLRLPLAVTDQRGVA